MSESGQLDLLIEKGTDFVLPYTIYDDNGSPLDLTGAVVESQLRRYAESAESFDFNCIHNGSGGRITLTMPNEITSQISFVHGVYDVKVTLANGMISHPLSGDVTIKENVTKAYDGSPLFTLGINSYDDLPKIGNIGRLYFCYAERKMYRWNGQNYIETLIGDKGDPGTSITGVERLYEDEYNVYYRLYFSDIDPFDYYVPKGEKGDPGKDGYMSATYDEEAEGVVFETDIPVRRVANPYGGYTVIIG